MARRNQASVGYRLPHERGGSSGCCGCFAGLFGGGKGPSNDRFDDYPEFLQQRFQRSVSSPAVMVREPPRNDMALLRKLLEECLEAEANRITEVFSRETQKLEDRLRGLDGTACMSAQLRRTNAKTDKTALTRRKSLDVIRSLQQKVKETEDARRRMSMQAGALTSSLMQVHRALSSSEGESDEDEEDSQHFAAHMLKKVSSKRNEYFEGKESLEEQIKKLQENVRRASLITPRDKETEELQYELSQLQMAVNARNRYACWVCNQEEQDDDDEEGQAAKRSEFEGIQRQIAEVKAEINQIQASGSGSSKSLGPRLGSSPTSVPQHSALKGYFGSSTPQKKAGLKFADDDQQRDSDKDEDQAPKSGRAVRARVQTGYVRAVDAAVVARGGGGNNTVIVGGITFDDAADVEEREITATPAGNPLRPSRGRVATPFISEDTAAGFEGGSGMRPQFSDVIQEEYRDPSEDAPSSGLRRTRDREATPFMASGIMQDGRGDDTGSTSSLGGRQGGVQFRAPDVEEHEVASSENNLRSSRARVATPFISERAALAQDPEVAYAAAPAAPKRPSGAELRFCDDVHVDLQEPSSDVPASGMRCVNGRDVTPFLRGAPMMVKAVKRASLTQSIGFNADGQEKKRVGFSSDLVHEETRETSPNANLRCSRNRITTPFISESALDSMPGAEAVSSSAHPRFQDDVDTSRVLPEGSAEDGSKKSRSRLATPFISNADLGFSVGGAAASQDDVHDVGDSPTRGRKSKQLSRQNSRDSPNSSRATQIRETRLEGIEASGATVRERLETGTSTTSEISSREHRYSIETRKRASMVCKVEQAINQRVKTFSQRRPSVRRLSASELLDQMRLSSADRGSSAEAALCERKVDTPLDGDDLKMLSSTLKSLDFFEEVDEKGIGALVDTMDLFSLQEADVLLRQGDTEGSHFFVVAEGQFAVIKDDGIVAVLERGDAFGESVLLLFGERSASVVAKGPGKVYGMDGSVVREVLREQYERKETVVETYIDELLLDGTCDLICKLPCQRQDYIYDLAGVRDLQKGETLLAQGPTTHDAIYILVAGSLVMKENGLPDQDLPKFHIIGDRGFVFAENPYTVVASQEAVVLELGRELLEILFVEERMNVALMHSRIGATISSHEYLQRLHEDNRVQMASCCSIESLEPGQELDVKDLRFVCCLHGEVEVTVSDDPATEMRLYRGTRNDCFGVEHLKNRQLSWSYVVKANNEKASTKVAVWCADDIAKMKCENMEEQMEQGDKIRILNKTFIFRTLAESQLNILASNLRVEHYNEGDPVFNQGEEGEEFYMVRRGSVMITINGRTIRSLGKGDVFGERALLFKENRSASVAAQEDSELWKIGQETFNEVLTDPIKDYLKDRVCYQDTKIELDDLNFLRVIGRGGFGVVRMVCHNKTGTRYALKCVKKKEIVANEQQTALATERSILAELDHPFVIKFVRSFRSDRYVYFLMEVVTGGELLEALEHLGLLKKKPAQFYIASILLALEFLHDKRIAYLDLKSENCLVDHQGYLKIIDFGIAQRIKSSKCHVVTGTPNFMAPEVILGKGYTCAADLWSCGVCLYEFMIGEFPFGNNCSNHSEIFRETMKAPLRFPKWFEDKNTEVMTLIAGLLTRDPVKRMGCGSDGYTSIKEHPFFQDGVFSWDGLLGRNAKPPYVPKREVYAEDREGLPEDQKAAQAAAQVTDPTQQIPLLLVEEEELKAEDKAMGNPPPWTDPAPGWDCDF